MPTAPKTTVHPGCTAVHYAHQYSHLQLLIELKCPNATCSTFWMYRHVTHTVRTPNSERIHSAVHFGYTAVHYVQQYSRLQLLLELRLLPHQVLDVPHGVLLPRDQLGHPQVQRLEREEETLADEVVLGLCTSNFKYKQESKPNQTMAAKDSQQIYVILLNAAP